MKPNEDDELSSGATDRAVDRRAILRGAGLVTATAVAGCQGSSGNSGGGSNNDSANTPGTPEGFGSGPKIPPVPENRPDAVYMPSHVEGMEMAGMAEGKGNKVALSYTLPHRFWTMQAGTGTKKVTLKDKDTVHLMVSVWDAKTQVYVTDAGPSIEVTKDGETVVGANNPWAMLSQPMGYHFGDNFQLDGEGKYAVTVETSAPTTTRIGSLSGRGGRGTYEFEFEFTFSKLREIMFKKFPDKKASKAAVDPMQMEMMPLSYAPEPGKLPGRTVGTGTSGDAKFVVQTLDRDGETYLAVSPRTPYNRFVIPQMSLKATVKRSGKTVTEKPLLATLGPELNHHYGATVDGIQDGDELRIDVQSPPQVARHEGYETAFLNMDPVSLTVGGGG